jgi:hypothetical protein
MRQRNLNTSGLRPRKPGEPRVPGSGRKKGTKNRRSRAIQELFSALVLDKEYQDRLRRDFTARRVHSSIESLIWYYHAGKPRECIELSGAVAVNQKLLAEREMLRATLEPDEIETLAIESQRIIDTAIQLARARRQLSVQQENVPDGEIAKTISRDEARRSS